MIGQTQAKWNNATDINAWEYGSRKLPTIKELQKHFNITRKINNQ